MGVYYRVGYKQKVCLMAEKIRDGEKEEMKHLEERNQKIIEAIINKANKECPESLALIGVNGSFMKSQI